jgi:two-component system LytT family response regulator
MKTIKTILVDDEPRGLSALQRLLEFNCPDIEIIVCATVRMKPGKKSNY